MAKLVSAIFKTRSNATLAVDDLTRHGFPMEDVSVMMTESSLGREFFVDSSSKAPEGGLIGTLVGAALGALIAALIVSGNLPDMGLGLTGADPIVGTLAGIAVGAMLGLLIGALVGASIPEHELNIYRVDRRHGGFLVGIYAHPKREREAKKLLSAAGGYHIRSKSVPTQAMHYYNTREAAMAGHSHNYGYPGTSGQTGGAGGATGYMPGEGGTGYGTNEPPRQ